MEFLVFRFCNNNLLLCSLFSQVIAYRLWHFGYNVPNTYLIFLAIIKFVFVYLIYKFLKIYKNKNLVKIILSKINPYYKIDFILLFLSLFLVFLWDIKNYIVDFRLLIIIFSIIYFFIYFKTLNFKFDYLITFVILFILIIIILISY